VFGLHLTDCGIVRHAAAHNASARERFAFRFGAQLVEDLSQRLNAESGFVHKLPILYAEIIFNVQQKVGYGN
jgi:hypothetical protein